MRDRSQFARVLFHPRIDGGIPLDSAVESQQFRSHRRSALFEIYGHLALYTRRQRNKTRGNLARIGHPILPYGFGNSVQDDRLRPDSRVAPPGF